MSSIEGLTEQRKIKSVEITESLNRIQHRDKANIEDAIVTPMPLYRQILQLYAEELSIQDLIYYLSEGLSRNSISLENFLKQIRLLTRKQFMLRATMHKAREKAGLPL
jgi:ESCRT-I complex subunit TSG101